MMKFCNPVDRHIGTRLLMLRILKGLSQQALANRLGITFQQIQKYETGRNRISASRLYAIAGVLGVPVGFFFEGLTDEDGERVPALTEAVFAMFQQLSPQFGARECLELNSAFSSLPDPELRAMFISLVERVADGRNAGGA